VGKTSVVEPQKSFIFWGWVFAIVVLLGGGVGGVVLWRRAQAVAQTIRSSIKANPTEPIVATKSPEPSSPPVESPASGEPSAFPKTPLPGQPQTRGALAKEIIQRIVRANLSQLRLCYEREWRRQPTLAGRVVVRFTIGPDGRVLSSDVQSSTLGNADVETCVVKQVGRLAFPPPKDRGNVMVVYPFVFSR